MENKFVFVQRNAEEMERIAAPQYSYWKSVFRNFLKSKVAILMLIISIFIVVMSIVVPLVTGYDHAQVADVNDFSTHFLSPSLDHWFGTDHIGRDLFQGVWTGTRNSLFISILATVITVGIGLVVGAFWGYSKKMDLVMLELYNIISNVPFTLLVMVILYVLGSGIAQLIFALSCTTWLSVAYFIRIQVMIIRDREYNLASRCLGTPMRKIVLHNIFPFLISVIMTQTSRMVPANISFEVFLSFLGIGLSRETASLGSMIQEFSVHMNSAPYMFWLPVLVSALISISLYMVGQTLSDASDPRTHMN